MPPQLFTLLYKRLAKTCRQYLTKGQRVLVIGEVGEPSTWTGREGNACASVEVRAWNVKFLSTRVEVQGHTPG